MERGSRTYTNFFCNPKVEKLRLLVIETLGYDFAFGLLHWTLLEELKMTKSECQMNVQVSRRKPLDSSSIQRLNNSTNLFQINKKYTPIEDNAPQPIFSGLRV